MPQNHDRPAKNYARCCNIVCYKEDGPTASASSLRNPLGYGLRPQLRTLVFFILMTFVGLSQDVRDVLQDAIDHAVVH